MLPTPLYARRLAARDFNTLVCATTGSKGVPVGTQTETPVMMTSGCPCDNTRSAPTTHCPVTHGPFPAGGTKAHPTIAYDAAMVATGMAETRTTGLGAVGVACPPCEQSTVAPM
jgi:hypothetical protein